MKKALLALVLTVVFISGYARSRYSLKTDKEVSLKSLRKGFDNPPPESGLRCYWWWLNSMATKESITRDLQEMKAKGYGGASIVDAGSSNYQVAYKTERGPVFMSPEWMELYKHAVREADRVGIELSVNVQSGWNPGAPTITPEFAMKKLVWSEVSVTGGKKISLELPQLEKKLMVRDILVQAMPVRDTSQVKNHAMKNWKKKSFNENIGWKGVYPLYQLREDYPGDGSEMAINKSDIIDLTSRFRDGRLEWDAPEGNWTIVRYGYTCTGAKTSTNSDGWEGLSVDHLNPEAFDLFSKTVIIPLIETAQSAGKSVRYLQTDSWEMGLVSWTNNFPREFLKFRGYDMTPYMPVLAGRIVGNREVSNRFLQDFRKTVGDCVAEYHYRLFYELAHKYGLGIHPESGGPHSAPVDALRVMGISDFPQGEFWAVANTHRIKDDERLSVKQSACVAHTNGKRFVAAEGPTSIGPQWERSPKDLKGNIDRIFCSGVNRIVWHTFTSSPKEFGLPGNEYFAGTHMNPNVTWWSQAGDWIKYLDRCCFLLQQGVFVADVLMYYGDDVPNFVFLKEDFPQLRFGYDWDKCSKDVVLNRLSVQNGKIMLPDGMTYRVLVLPDEDAIDLEVLRKVETLVNSGMTLVARRPEKATGLNGYPGTDTELKQIAERLWRGLDGKTMREKSVGKGRVIWGKDINDVLGDMKVVPDFAFRNDGGNTALDYIHRTTDNQEIYFVANRFARKEISDFEFRYITSLPDRYEFVNCTFRVSGKVPNLWNPKTGEMQPIPTYREENGMTTLPLFLEPDGSAFVVFTSQKPERHIVSVSLDGKGIFPVCQATATEYPFFTTASGSFTPLQAGEYRVEWSDGSRKTIRASQPPQVKNLASGWQVKFDPAWGGPASMVLPELKSWTCFDDPGIRYYSGTATYSNHFQLAAAEITGKNIVLDLGNVQEMGFIRINGHKLPTVWSAPFRYDISAFVKAGDNELEVEVVNMWTNRLIGDAALPEGERRTRTNVKKFNGPDGPKYLRESGLLGPVTIRTAGRIALN